MTPKRKPATPLPWKIPSQLSPEIFAATHEQGHNIPVGSVQTFRGGGAQDAEYIVHACNTYPDLVRDRARLLEALRGAENRAQELGDRGGKVDALECSGIAEGIRALLRELGE